jgi:hypothetical protein
MAARKVFAAMIAGGDGNRYGRGPGLNVLANGKQVVHAPRLQPLRLHLPAPAGSQNLKTDDFSTYTALVGTSVPDRSTPSQSAQKSCSYPGRIIVAGGFHGINDATTAFDSVEDLPLAGEAHGHHVNQTRSVGLLPKMPQPRGLFGMVAVPATNQIFAIGGQSFSTIGGTGQRGLTSTVQRLDLMPTPKSLTGSWELMPTDAPLPQSAFGVGVINESIYLVGGLSQAATPTCAVSLEYNTSDGSWETKKQIRTPRSFLAAGGVNGKIYAVGGYGNGTGLSIIEAYDPITDTWNGSLTSMPTARAELAVAVRGNVLFAVGGKADGGAQPAPSPGPAPPENCNPVTGQLCPNGTPCPKCGQPACVCPGGNASVATVVMLLRPISQTMIHG